MQVNQYPKQGSDVLSSMVWADGLVEIPEEVGQKVKK
jgi:molybdopterin molybdotransferase